MDVTVLPQLAGHQDPEIHLSPLSGTGVAALTVSMAFTQVPELKVLRPAQQALHPPSYPPAP